MMGPSSAIQQRPMHYYAIRELGEEDHHIDAVPITYIAKSDQYYSAQWIHRRLERLSKHLSYIEEWEYDMLDAFGVPEMTVSAVFEWKSIT